LKERVVKFLAANDRDKRLVEFQDILHVPNLRTNLISVAKITDRDHVVTFRKNMAVVTNQKGEVKLTADVIYITSEKISNMCPL